MALLAMKNRSVRIILFHGDAIFEVPHSHAQSLQESGQEEPAQLAPAVIFEYCPFGDVECFISKWHPVLTQTIIYHWTRHVAEGLQFLASFNIVHADLIPKIILVRADKTLVVADLGRSFVATTPQNTHRFRATVSSAWPEILRQTGINPAAELFSLGLIV